MADDDDGSLTDLFPDDKLSQELAAIIRTLGPNDRLPAERDLAVRLGVNRATLRGRLGILEGLGLLSRRTGSGTYVRELQPTSLATALSLAIDSSQIDVASLESVRIALERQAAHDAALRADPVLIAYMKRALNSMESLSEFDQTRMLEADQAFHQALLRAAGNSALSFFATALAGVLRSNLIRRIAALGRLEDEPGAHQELVVQHHQAIYEAVVSGDATAAMRAVDEHFEVLYRTLEVGSADMLVAGRPESRQQSTTAVADQPVPVAPSAQPVA